MWVFDDIGGASYPYAGYLWVNTSTVLSISSTSTFSYGSDAELEITVTEDGNNAACMIAVLDPDNNTVYHEYSQGTATLDQTYFEYAGKYTIKAYRDLDKYGVFYYYGDEDEDGNGVNDAYDPAYGNGLTFPIGITEGYDYTTIGPWDPPEKNATKKTFSVGTGKPNIILTNTTIYWGFETRIDINVTNNTGAGLDFTPSPIVLKYGSKYIPFSITNEGNGNYSLELDRFDEGTDWEDLATALGDDNVNGTWRVVFGYDANGDDTYEWNNTASFTVKSVSPPVQLVIVNDGSGSPSDKKVDVPEYISPTGQATTIDIVFDIFGRSIIDEYRNAYYGDDPDELDGAMDNITIEGDILYPVTETDLVYSGSKGRWTVTVTPTKPGGEITLTIDWPGDENGSATQTIEIVNGTYVTSAVDAFTVGSDYNLTVTVTDMDQAVVKNARVYLMWEDLGVEFNSTIGNNGAGNGLNGEYTFWIQPYKKDSTTPDVAPQNITVAARWYEGFWGYTKVIMDRNHNMIVNMTPTTAYAGDAVEYDIMVSLAGGGNPDTNGLSVALFNETGEYVTGVDEWYKDGAYDITDELIPLSGGTYYIFAMNDTCDSRGNNATLIVTSYVVASSPSTLAWKIDDAVNMTFQLTPAGDGTLTIYNMTGSPEASILGDTTEISVEDGVGTLDEVNASTLGNVTFSYRPDGGEDRPADGLLRVTTATATPNPATIYNGEATLVTITITHPATGTPLEGVDVRLEAWNATLTDTVLAKIPDNETTDADGIVQFSITAEASGEVIIYMENASDPDNEFVIVATARKPMTIYLNPSVDEGDTFTVEARSNDVLITDTTVTFTFDGQTWPTNTGVATITAPTVSTSMAYPITASAEGYITATGVIVTVLNIPKLIVAIAGEVKAGQTFTLTVADDTGKAVIGATVTFEGNTYTTGAGGTVTITAPSKAGNYPVTATFPGYDPISDTITIEEGGGIPGFELLTLIAAIGVAFLLLRRRRK
ncbi:hypothetical protein AYK25_07635 [Thermoplasmatales archaeon SM1-50]|nr:MAG: hypothetical protein AYK25_07635 [Thermoplasmatales archaeon SM1-50]